MSARVLVTGGTGFTGTHLVTQLLESGQAVRVVTRSSDRARETLPGDAEILTGDLTDESMARRAVRGVSVVYHLAAAFREPGIPDARYREVHVSATRHLLEAALDQGVERFVHCSTVGVHVHVEHPPADENTPHRPGDVYQATKSEGERLALEFQRAHGFPLTVARPTAIYGPGDLRLLKMFRLIARRRFPILGDGKIYYHMVYVTDLVTGLRLLAEHPKAVGETFIVGGATFHTLNEICETIANAVGAAPPRLHLPARPFQLAGSLCERISIPLGLTPPIYRRRVDFFTKSRAFSIEKARRLLGYAPRVELDEGIRLTADWYRREGYLPRAR
jgi:nucleoside-diphosphate-sugar epimerase